MRWPHQRGGRDSGSGWPQGTPGPPVPALRLCPRLPGPWISHRYHRVMRVEQSGPDLGVQIRTLPGRSCEPWTRFLHLGTDTGRVILCGGAALCTVACSAPLASTQQRPGATPVVTIQNVRTLLNAPPIENHCLRQITRFLSALVSSSANAGTKAHLLGCGAV